MNRRILLKKGFTIVELLIVVAIIGILATVVAVGYNGIQQSARDKALLSEMDSIESELARSATKNGGIYDQSLAWDSSKGTNAKINFVPAPGDVVIVNVSVDGKSYCVRAYNPSSNAKTLATAKQKGSTTNACQPQWSSTANGAAGSVNACSITLYGSVYCWGSNPYGGLGNNSTAQANAPVAVYTGGVLADKIIGKVSVGQYHSCAIDMAGVAYCWGYNAKGQLGDGTTNDSSKPVAVNMTGALNGKTLKAISSSYYNNCSIASDGKAYCWGDNGSGQLGNGTTTSSSIPVAVDASGVLSGKAIAAIAAGSGNSCAIASDGYVYCWGGPSYIGNGSAQASLVPAAVDRGGVLAGKFATKLSVGGGFSCVIASDGKAYCWGVNSFGQLGNGLTATSLVPVAVSTAGVLNGKTVKEIASTGNQSCVIASDNKAYCWGSNSNGQLGNGTTTNSSVPVAVDTSGALSGKSLKSIMVSNNSACATDTDNQYYCWGYGGWGQLGNGSTTNSLVPVKVTAPAAL